MIEAQVSGHRPEPTARPGIVAEFIEMFVGFQKHFLADVFGVSLIGEQTHGGAKYHILVVVQEHLELTRIGHGQATMA